MHTPLTSRIASTIPTERDNLLRHCLAQALRPAQKAVEKLRGIERGEDAIEGLVTGDAVVQAQERLEPSLLGAPEIRPVMVGLGPAAQGADGADEAVDQILRFGAIDAGIGDGLEVVAQTEFGWGLAHPKVEPQPADFRKQNLSPAARCARPTDNNCPRFQHKKFSCVCPGLRVSNPQRRADTVTGAVRWIRDRGLPIRDDQGRVYRIAGGAEDITRQIAARLSLDVKTVETYRARIKVKLQLTDATALLQYAIQWLRSRA